MRIRYRISEAGILNFKMQVKFTALNCLWSEFRLPKNKPVTDVIAYELKNTFAVISGVVNIFGIALLIEGEVFVFLENIAVYIA